MMWSKSKSTIDPDRFILSLSTEGLELAIKNKLFVKNKRVEI